MSILGTIFSGGAKDLVEGVGNVIDGLHTSDEERLAAEQKIKELVANYETQMEKEITARWSADMKSDSWLSKNVRPMVLIFLVVCTVLMIFIDAGTIAFEVEQKWTDLLQIVLITVIGAYFGGRSLEKTKK
jgi:hypothetical protein|tara:strand:+ start:159 stop:551 length:393 start_codon:yes stop_codon:yes gene_type:complete